MNPAFLWRDALSRAALSVRASDKGVKTCAKVVALARCAPLPEQEAVPYVIKRVGRLGPVLGPAPPDMESARRPTPAVPRPAAALQVTEATLTLHGEAVPAPGPVLMEATAVVPAVVARLDRSSLPGAPLAPGIVAGRAAQA